MSKSSRQIAKTLMSDRSVRRIAKMDLELSAFRRMPAQVLSDAVKLKRLEQNCRALALINVYQCAKFQLPSSNSFGDMEGSQNKKVGC